MKKFVAILSAFMAVSFISAVAQAGSTLDAIKKKGFIQCGVNTGLAGFSLADSKGQWTGLDVDSCRAVAAAVFGDASKVKFTPLNAQQRFTALQSGEIDILSRNTTWTMTRDGSLGFNFTVVTFYDGQGFMVPKKLGVKSVQELGGAAICVQSGTTTELNLTDYFRAHKIKFKPVVFEALGELKTAFFNGRCQVFTADASGLASVRASDAKNPKDYVILPEIISKEPLGPVVRRGDDEWFAIVKWSIYAMINAEEQGLNSGNIGSFMNSKNPNVMRLLGKSGNLGKLLGLSNDWAVNIIKQVGNYGESFERNVGSQSKLGQFRGLNALWTQGGLIYGMPIR